MVLLLLSSQAAYPQKDACPLPEQLQGAWAEQETGTQISFEPTQIVLFENEVLRVAAVLHREPCKLFVRDQGVLSTWNVQAGANTVTLDRGKGAVVLRRLPVVPETLDASPLPLPSPMPIAPEVAQEIARTLAGRADKDQQAIHTDGLNRSEVLRDNIRYLREVTKQYGWIDIPRFGKAGAAAAIAICKHSSDLRLLRAALPVIEQDARENGGGKELVAISVDEVLIASGQKQKYGTQFTEDSSGKPFVIPVEDVTKVDLYRKDLGILSWSDYLAKASQFVYGGTPIRIPGPEE